MDSQENIQVQEENPASNLLTRISGLGVLKLFHFSTSLLLYNVDGKEFQSECFGSPEAKPAIGRNLDSNIECLEHELVFHRFPCCFDSLSVFLGQFYAKADISKRTVKEPLKSSKNLLEGIMHHFGKLENSLRALDTLAETYLSHILTLAVLFSKIENSKSGERLKSKVKVFSPDDVFRGVRLSKAHIPSRDRASGSCKKKSEEEQRLVFRMRESLARLRAEERYWKAKELLLRDEQERMKQSKVSSNSTPLKESLLLNSDRIGEITEDWERLKKSAPPATKVKLQQIAQKIQDSLVKARVSAQEKSWKKLWEQRQKDLEEEGGSLLLRQRVKLHYSRKKRQ